MNSCANCKSHWLDPKISSFEKIYIYRNHQHSIWIVENGYFGIHIVSHKLYYIIHLRFNYGKYSTTFLFCLVWFVVIKYELRYSSLAYIIWMCVVAGKFNEI